MKTHLNKNGKAKCGAEAWSSYSWLSLTNDIGKVDCNKCLGTVVRRKTEPTRAQRIKKVLKGHFENLKCINGKGTASGWVEMRFDYPKPENCSCEGKEYTCYECSEAINKAKEEVYRLIREAKIELSTYYVDDGYNTRNTCMLIDVKLI